MLSTCRSTEFDPFYGTYKECSFMYSLEKYKLREGAQIVFIFKCTNCPSEKYSYSGPCKCGSKHVVTNREKMVLQKIFPKGPESFLTFKLHPHLMFKNSKTNIEFTLRGNFSFDEGFLLWGPENSKTLRIKKSKFNTFAVDTQGRVEDVSVDRCRQKFQFQGRTAEGIIVSQIFAWEPYDMPSHNSSFERFNVGERRFDITR